MPDNTKVKKKDQIKELEAQIKTIRRNWLYLSLLFGMCGYVLGAAENDK